MIRRSFSLGTYSINHCSFAQRVLILCPSVHRSFIRIHSYGNYSYSDNLIHLSFIRSFIHSFAHLLPPRYRQDFDIFPYILLLLFACFCLPAYMFAECWMAMMNSFVRATEFDVCREYLWICLPCHCLIHTVLYSGIYNIAGIIIAISFILAFGQSASQAVIYRCINVIGVSFISRVEGVILIHFEQVLP